MKKSYRIVSAALGVACSLLFAALFSGCDPNRDLRQEVNELKVSNAFTAGYIAGQSALITETVNDPAMKAEEIRNHNKLCLKYHAPELCLPE